ncbi:thioester dehydrase family protein [Campylobacter sputorum subsp. bubulus]|uniref:Thioester dehydrase family protein n=1 Tax=Campylobacter sputorum subsp. sputorum TaxID=32024 RepID=A0A381DKE2_9BACT|nr:hypothetical protein [Campylobacter sputorum]ASM34305.1 hypothetical protein CSPUT_0036 [Campylobacter sputorum aubsp. sputorum RM3237]ASM35971.1 hypothetical protein CSF_0039 [Campylobacter sputorum bv. faecalis CCUG 20703]KAB0582302.1 hypothetical protein F7P64_03260 [Campylobacter sputorum subsp. sputorum]QEL04496.1 hypothetical protein CSPT_0036 [Campylobacter sputorum subsp. sputorum]SUX09270.1 thioester dehydrase family protein [Campylobacter sputorum subsp. bubulus]
MNLGLMITIAAMVAIVMYIQINKLTKKIDEDPNDTSVYNKFCEAINNELMGFKEQFLNDESLNLISKSEFDSKIDDFIKELKFIQTMNANRKDSKIWENSLFTFLDKIDKFINTNTKNGEENADRLRNNLMLTYKKEM